jgi:hypothetical protein
MSRHIVPNIPKPVPNIPIVLRAKKQARKGPENGGKQAIRSVPNIPIDALEKASQRPAKIRR